MKQKDAAAEADVRPASSRHPSSPPTRPVHLSPEKGLPREFVQLKAPRRLVVDLAELTPTWPTSSAPSFARGATSYRSPRPCPCSSS
jgi:hypothetical protein